MDETREFPVISEALKSGPPSMRPIAGREAPVVWVQRLAIYSAWPPSEETRLRQIELRRGLNVVWANPSGKNPDAPRLAGHGAGKSTFCRLLRYVLDDREPGTEQFRKGFQGTIGIGWALAEVHVSGQVWLVGRPIADNASGYHSFAFLDGALGQVFPERPPRVGYADYTAALDAAVFGGMPLRTLPGSRQKLDWSQLIQWLSRDQEAHFRGLLEWRDNDSDSESVKISMEDRASLVRLVLGLVQEKEQELLEQHATKSATHEAKVRERAKLEFAITRDRDALAGAIERPVGDPKDSVLQLEISNHVLNLRNQADAAVRAARQDEDNAPLLDAVAQAQAQYEIVWAFADDLRAQIETLEMRLKGVTPPPQKQSQQSDLIRTLSSFVPFQDVCSQPIDAAWEAKCPLARSRPEDPAIKKLTEAATGSHAAKLQAELERLRIEHTRRIAIAADKKRALESAQALLRAARDRQIRELESLKEPARNAAQIEALHRSYAKGCADLELLNTEIKGLHADKDALNDVLKTLTKQHAELMEKFTRLFHHIARHMLAEAITGRVVFAGKAIEPRLSYEGDRDSAALKVTKWVAFDLAALAFGMTTKEAHHPRFLLHDSPRESDMAPIIYGGLFHAARELEADYGESAAFQYVVTTTEPPPEDFKGTPWLRLELDASTKAGRFLGVNL